MSDQKIPHLIVAKGNELKDDSSFSKSNSIEISTEFQQQLTDKADHYVAKLLSVDLDNHDSTISSKDAVETIGIEVQKEASQQFSMLKMPIKTIMSQNQDDGDVGKHLIDLKLEVENLDPSQFDFEAGWLSRVLGFLPGVGTPLKRYFSKFESAQDVIAAVVNSLEKGKDQLERDNISIQEDQKQMRETTHRLDKTIELGKLIDKKLVYKCDREITDSRMKSFVQEEMIFPLRQRIVDLQQQLAVNQQGILSLEIIVRNNKELVRGVSRALNVTVNALQVAGTVAMALNNQKLVLEKINAINSTTDSLIAGTANRLKTQGVEIQKQASGAQINLDTLKTAFSDINTALNDLSSFKQEALPVLAQTMLDMDNITTETETKLKEIEESRKSTPLIVLEP
ncbi:MAG: toxic anion resistance protein [Bacteriovoracaceae bacterium]|jgi:uncharacterized protein YaaN involved in tellurite resistance|nr:toxic anion resistance protein [Bacteriovoracaceae bacterium]